MAVIAASAAVLAGKADRAQQLLAAAPAASAQEEGLAQDAPPSWLPLMGAELAAREGNWQKVTSLHGLTNLLSGQKTQHQVRVDSHERVQATAPRERPLSAGILLPCDRQWMGTANTPLLGSCTAQDISWKSKLPPPRNNDKTEDAWSAMCLRACGSTHVLLCPSSNGAAGDLPTQPTVMSW